MVENVTMIVFNLGNRGSIDLNPGMKSRPQRLKAAILALLFRTTLSRALPGWHRRFLGFHRCAQRLKAQIFYFSATRLKAYPDTNLRSETPRLRVGRGGAGHGLVIQNNTWYILRIMGSAEKTISFRAVVEKIDTLDSLAAAQERSRSYLINQAISNYIELHAYQDALVRKGLEEMRRGRVVSHQDVVKRLKRAGRGRRSSGRSSNK